MVHSAALLSHARTFMLVFDSFIYHSIQMYINFQFLSTQEPHWSRIVQESAGLQTELLLWNYLRKKG
jgi:hypothetical protein